MSLPCWKCVAAVLALGMVAPSTVDAIVPGQTGPFPQSGEWAGSNWGWDSTNVYHWNSYWNGNHYDGTAVAVAPNFLLTAGHVDGKPGDHAVINGQTYNAVRSYTAPVDPLTNKSPDLRLIEVDKTLPGYHTLYTGPITKGRQTFLIGFGQTGTYNGETGAVGWQSGTEGVGRWGTNLIASSTPQRLSSGNWSSLSFAMTDYSDADTPYEAFAGGGDSGGGVFVKVGDTWQLAGIMTNSSSTRGDTWAVALPIYSDWILETANVPEPVGLTLLAGAGACLLHRRRR